MKDKIKYVFFMTALFCLFVLTKKDVSANSAVITNNDDGTVTLRYNNPYDVRVKLLVQLNGGKQYKYDVPRGDVNLKIPLTQGNGEYRFILCRNISGSRYAVMQTMNITQTLSAEAAAYLTSNYMISWEDANAAVKKAQVLARKGKNKKVKYIYDYVVKNYSYDYDKARTIDKETDGKAYIPDVSSVYSEHKGICYDISVLLASMLRSVNVPTKVVTGYTPNATVYHAWNNIYAGSDWKVVDATYDLQMHRAGRKYSMFKNRNDYKDVVYTY